MLNSSLEGKGLLNLNKNVPLENVSRINLVRLICTYILKNGPSDCVTAKIYIKWAQEIVRIFPQEKITVYFHNKIFTCPQGVKNRLAGKLPDQIHNLKKRYRDFGLIPKRRKISCEKDNGDSNNSSRLLLNLRLPEAIETPGDLSDDDDDNILWLQNSSDPWVTVEAKWKETTLIRLTKIISNKTIDDYFRMFPALQKPLGYVLVSLEIFSLSF